MRVIKSLILLIKKGYKIILDSFLITFQTFVSIFNFKRFSTKKRHHFFINLVIGVLIVIILHFLQHTRWGESTLDKFFDFFIFSESKKAVRIKKNFQESPILFVDIDHQTYKKWGEPLITPRDKLAKIIRTVFDGGAKVIALDILLEQKDVNPNNDKIFLDVIESILHDTKNKTTKIILSQRIGFEKDLKENIFSYLYENENTIPGSQFKRFYMAVPNISSSSADGVIRYWNLYEDYIDGDGKNRIIWGFPIMTAILAIDGNISHLNRFEKKVIKAKKKKSIVKHVEEIKLSNDKTIRLSFDKSHSYNQRIRFLLIPKGIQKDIADKNSVFIEENLFQIVVNFHELDDYKDYFKDRIVIIGNSSPDHGDIHRTPIGKMAGIYVLGNSINTILTKEQPSLPQAWINIFIELVVIILASYAFLYFTSILAQFIVSIFILVVLGYFGYLYFLNTGVFLNFVFAVIGMGFHETVANLEEMIEKRGLKKYNRKKH